MLTDLFGSARVLIGVVHLLPLPGSPRWKGDMDVVLSQARSDAEALARGGCHGVIVENFGDAPLAKGRVGPHTVSAVTVAASSVRDVLDVPLGINVLRNDDDAALAIAHVTGARFVRVNVHTGAMVADEGVIEGRAHETLRYRRELGADVRIFADVLVKHAAPIGDQDLGRAARTAVERGLADAVIVSGPMTGEPTSPGDVAAAKEMVPDVPVLVGSGVTEDNVEELMRVADGAIVGTSLKLDGVVTNQVDQERVARMARLLR